MEKKGDGKRLIQSGTLFVVATPIGNLEDITLRAIRVLKEVSLVAVEDTRVARKLFNHYGINTPYTSYFEHNEKKKAPIIMEKLSNGEDVALISDAGTPGISDPGFRLIRLAVESSINVTPVPGPSAPAAILSISGLPFDRVTFLGFVPHGRAARKRFLLDLLGGEETFVIFDSTRRIKATLKDIIEVLGDVEVVAAREVTKLHEEIIRGRASNVAADIASRELKGEITLVIRTEGGGHGEGALTAHLEDFLKSGLPLKEVVKALSREYGVPRSEAYKEALVIKKRLGL
ncbi:MAG: 16S rRNA (cytidine(1402)-2'-O)-methyltransferase [Thermodesulfobacteriota bacterium]|nr:MAG: 16S rRNA (cytidine(1402)-2'-O)-methyltransferase [Thermodesulfobacteriota bacterium]